MTFMNLSMFLMCVVILSISFYSFILALPEGGMSHSSHKLTAENVYVDEDTKSTIPGAFEVETRGGSKKDGNTEDIVFSNGNPETDQNEWTDDVKKAFLQQTLDGRKFKHVRDLFQNPPKQFSSVIGSKIFDDFQIQYLTNCKGKQQNATFLKEDLKCIPEYMLEFFVIAEKNPNPLQLPVGIDLKSFKVSLQDKKYENLFYLTQRIQNQYYFFRHQWTMKVFDLVRKLKNKGIPMTTRLTKDQAKLLPEYLREYLILED